MIAKTGKQERDRYHSAMDQQLRSESRRARFRTLRDWALGLGIVSLLLALIVGRLVAGEAIVRDWRVPAVLGAAGAALLIASALAHGIAARKEGEV